MSSADGTASTSCPPRGDTRHRARGTAGIPPAWRAQARQARGTRWDHWAQWITARGGPQAPAPTTLGSPRPPGARGRAGLLRPRACRSPMTGFDRSEIVWRPDPHDIRDANVTGFMSHPPSRHAGLPRVCAAADSALAKAELGRKDQELVRTSATADVRACRGGSMACGQRHPAVRSSAPPTFIDGSCSGRECKLVSRHSRNWKPPSSLWGVAAANRLNPPALGDVVRTAIP